MIPLSDVIDLLVSDNQLPKSPAEDFREDLPKEKETLKTLILRTLTELQETPGMHCFNKIFFENQFYTHSIHNSGDALETHFPKAKSCSRGHCGGQAFPTSEC